MNNRNRTFSAKAHEVKRRWWIINAAGKHLGRVAVEAATLLMGKHKPIYTTHVDTGDYVIIINASEVEIGGKKNTQKEYMTFSGYVGGHKSETFEHLLARQPGRVIEHAIKGMLPHNRLGSKMYRKLNVFPGADHIHAAQQPQEIFI